MMKNLGQMMKQVQELQERMQAVQAKLETLSIEGRAGGGLVQVTLNGKGAMIVSPYLKRPLRSLEEAQAEAERLALDQEEAVRDEPRRALPAEREAREGAAR